jgi:methylated-DNA-[protein]-cysteine S-methyltransferase
MQYEVFETALGPMGVVVHELEGVKRLAAVRVGHSSITATEVEILKRFPKAVSTRGLEAAKLLTEYAREGVADFSAIILDDDQATPFDRGVRRACRKIPFGTTVTYADLAVLAGSERNSARAVGGVMRRNSCPIIVPCHRVVPAGKLWALGNYSAPQGPALKRRLLELEGFNRTESPRKEARRRTPTRGFEVASSSRDE